jgi:Zn-dependent peptidase ImmA (M78 family)
MPTELTEIEELAESIAEQYLDGYVVNVTAIAQAKSITIIHEDYGNYFLGQLVHERNNFYLHVNREQLPELTDPRARFTIAHDCGHYFIDNHRNRLKKGISLTYIKGAGFGKPFYEKEADHFAAHLLMPKTRFISLADYYEPGIDAILGLKNQFDTSIECTAMHYTKLDVKPCLFIRWRAAGKPYAYSSPSLRKLTGIKEWATIKLNQEYLNSLYEEIESSSPRIPYAERVNNLSKWVANIAPESDRDLIGLEQTFKLGDYGGITFLTF